MINDATSILLYDYIDVSRKIFSFFTSYDYNVNKIKDSETYKQYYLYYSRRNVLKIELEKRGLKV